MATQRRLDIKGDVALVGELDALKGELGTTSRPSTIRRLVQAYREQRKSKEGHREATLAIMSDDRPALIAGTSGAGKTRTIKALIKDWSGPVFALDVKGVDYPDYERLDLGRISSYDWAAAENAGPKRLRFTPTTELSAQGETEAVLQLLALVMRQEGTPLKAWTLILEEGQRFTKNLNFKEILSEGRVFCRKILVGSQLSRPFKELVQTYSPASLAGAGESGLNP